MKSVGALWASYRTMRGEQSYRARELTNLAIAVLLGLTLVPLAIWLVGQLVFGPYVREVVAPGVRPQAAGPLLLWVDFIRGLASGSPGHWCVALSPYVIYLIWRWAGGIRSRS